MIDSTNVISRINDTYQTMSKGQKLIANYILDYYDKAVFYTAAKLAEIVGVSESTVVRFATHIGYKGYPQFIKGLEELITSKLDEASAKDEIPLSTNQDEILDKVINGDIKKLTNTLENIDRYAFNKAIDMITDARKIYIIGIRSCNSLASFLAFYLRMICNDVFLIDTNNSSEIFEQMLNISEEDLIIGISFPRYSMRTIKALQYAATNNAKIITITDSINSPLRMYCSCNLVAESNMMSVVDSLVAPMSLINALIATLCVKNQDVVARRLDLLENVWDEYQIHGKDEIDVVDDAIKMHYPHMEKNDE